MIRQWRRSATWPHRVRESAFVESLQEQIPNHRMRFLELVEKQNGKWLFADAIDQRVGVGECGGLPEDLADRVRGLEFAHIEPDHPVDRAE
jgi:hypothetical protein